MCSLFKTVLLPSLLFAVPALAETTEMTTTVTKAGQSDDFKAKKKSTVQVTGTITPQGQQCFDAFKAVEFKLERVEGKKSFPVGSSKRAELVGSDMIVVQLATAPKVDDFYRVTWIPTANVSMNCQFTQNLKVTFDQAD